MTQKLTCFFFLILLNIQSISAVNNPLSDTICITPPHKDLNIFLSGRFKLYIDTTDQKSLQTIYEESSKDSIFIKSNYPSHLGKADVNFWLRFYLKNEGKVDATYYIDMCNIQTDIVSLYQQKPNDTMPTLLYETGDKYSFSERPLFTRTFVLPIKVPAGQISCVFLKLYNEFEPISLPLYLKTPETYQNEEFKFLILVSLCLGTLLLFVLMSSYFFMLYHQKVYFFYSLYVSCIVLWIVSNYGLGYQWFWCNSPIWQFKSATVFAGLYTMFFMTFTAEFLELKKHIIKLYRLIYIWFWIGCCELIFLVICPIKLFKLTNTWFYAVFYPTSFICLGLVGASIWLVFKENRNAINKIIVFVYSLIILTVLLLVSREIIIMPISFFTEHSVFFGSVLEAIGIGFAIAISLNAIIKDREKLLVDQTNYQKSLLTTEIITEEKERKRIAEDLHDDLGMLLVTAKLNLNEFSEIKNQQAANSLDKSLEVLRNITSNLYPAIVDKFGFESALNEMLENVKLSAPFELEYNTVSLSPVLHEHKINLYRIVSELLTNTLKHSKAKKVYFSISEYTSENITFLNIIIVDDGIGFSLDKSYKGLGVSNVSRRVNALNGNIKIKSDIGKGTKIEIDIPLNLN